MTTFTRKEVPVAEDSTATLEHGQVVHTNFLVTSMVTKHCATSTPHLAIGVRLFTPPLLLLDHVMDTHCHLNHMWATRI